MSVLAASVSGAGVGRGQELLGSPYIKVSLQLRSAFTEADDTLMCKLVCRMRFTYPFFVDKDMTHWRVRVQIARVYM